MTTDREELLRWRTRASTEFYVLWGLALLTYGIGDIVTTLWVVYGDPTLGEANPLIRWLLQTLSVPGFVGVKLAVFVIGARISWTAVTRGSVIFYYAPPLGMIVFGLYATAVNLVLIL